MTLASIALAWLGAGASTALWAFVRSRGRAMAVARHATPVLLLRPCAGDEPRLAEALASSRAVPVGSRVRFLVADASDQAMPVARSACADVVAEGIDARVVVTAARTANRKAGQLAAGIAEEPAAPEIILVADSDVLLTSEVVADLTAPLAAGEASAAWAPPVEAAPRTLGDAASAAVLGASLHAFALLSALDPRGMVGKTFAIRRDALDRIGGFRVLVDVLGEDMELAHRLRAAGSRVVVTARPALSLAGGRSWRAATERYARWLVVLRAQRPLLLAAYPLLVAAAPIQLGVALAALGRGEEHASLAVGLVFAVRALVATLARRRSRGGGGDVLFLPWLADLALLTALSRALSTRTIRWRGVLLRVARGEPLAEIER